METSLRMKSRARSIALRFYNAGSRSESDGPTMSVPMARETLCQATERILIITRARYRPVCTPTRYSRTNDLRSAVVRISAIQRDNQPRIWNSYCKGVTREQFTDPLWIRTSIGCQDLHCNVTISPSKFLLVVLHSHIYPS